MKKALIISNSSGLITDFLDNDFKILKDKGYKIVCACNTKYPGKYSDSFFEKYDVEVLNVDFPIRNLDFKKIIKSYFQLKKIMSNHHFDLVHCHSTIAACIGRHVAKKYKKKGTKLFYTSHGFPFYSGNDSKKSKIFYMIEKHYSKYSDCILTICNEDYENAKKMKCNNVRLMHGVGVNVDNFINCNIDKKQKRKELNIDGDTLAILSVGELNNNKNHQIIIRALAEMQEKNITYVICGRELTEVGKKEELSTLARNLDVNVLFLGFRKDIPEVCQACDIGALPSFKEGLGLSGIEMLASGIPVVGSNRQGIKDYIVDGETGYLADPESHVSFKNAIENTIVLLENKNTKNKCVNMTKKFTKMKSYEALLEAYNSINI